jgi:hypothetical protein
MEQFDEIDIIFLLPEMLLEQVVDGRFNHESIVDGDVSDFWLFISSHSSQTRELAHHSVPTWLTSPGHGVVTDIVPDQETSLELYISFGANRG